MVLKIASIANVEINAKNTWLHLGIMMEQYNKNIKVNRLSRRLTSYNDKTSRAFTGSRQCFCVPYLRENPTDSMATNLDAKKQ